MPDDGARALDLRRRVAAEALGTAFLLAAVVGSGIVAAHLMFAEPLLQLSKTVRSGPSQ